MRQLAAAGPGESTDIINAMLQELNDSHCGFGLLADLARVASPYVFFPGEPGLDIRLLGGRVVVTDVDGDSPAATAGISPGFILLTIDGQPIEEIIESAVLRAPHTEANKIFHQTETVLRRLFGEPDTTITVTFLDGGGAHHSALLRRARRQGGITLDPALPEIFVAVEERQLNGEICYLRFPAFQPDTPDQVLSAIDRCPKSEPLLLDLRGNNGGSAEATSRILSSFVRQTSLVYTRVGRDREIPVLIEPAVSRHEGPVVIMVDELSIFAAENLAGIMQHLGLAEVLGRRTPGQVLWGESRTLNGGAMLFLPTAQLLYPDGSNLEGLGVTPDLSVALQREDLLSGFDTQIQAAVNLLQSMREPSHADIEDG